MTRAFRVGLLVALAPLVVVACKRTTTTSTAGAPSSAVIAMTPTLPPPSDAGVSVPLDAGIASIVDASITASDEPRAIGPYELPFADKRNVYFVLSALRAKRRLIANLHGMCNPPGYACGYWTHAASQEGFLICPTGNSTCGAAMFNAPTWTEPFAKMDEDLEKAIATVDAAYPGEISREGAILTGFSKGGFAAPEIAKMHPGRWPYLLINEANVAINATQLRKSGVRAVALVAGERGGEIHGERATVAALTAQKFPAKLWVMPGAAHYYSANIDDIMHEAIEWLLAQPVDAPDGG